MDVFTLLLWAVVLIGFTLVCRYIKL